MGTWDARLPVRNLATEMPMSLTQMQQILVHYLIAKFEGRRELKKCQGVILQPLLLLW